MAALGDTRQHRHTFFVFSVLIAANLVLIVYNVAKSNTSSGGSQSNFQSNPISLQSILEEVAQDTGIPDGITKTASKTVRVYHHSAAFVGSTIQSSSHFVGHTTNKSLLAMVHAEDDVISFTASAVSLNTYIKPATPSRVPVIAPVSTVALVKAIAAVDPPAPVNTAAQEATVIKTITASPIPASDMTNTYAWGNCTWWAAIERARVDDPIPNTWGNAATWAERAAYDGYVVNHTPTPGSIMQTADAAGGLGHVAFVTSVDPDGTWHISEMNVLGLDRVDERAMSSATAAYYYFIHDKS